MLRAKELFNKYLRKEGKQGGRQVIRGAILQ